MHPPPPPMPPRQCGQLTTAQLRARQSSGCTTHLVDELELESRPRGTFDAAVTDHVTVAEEHTTQRATGCMHPAGSEMDEIALARMTRAQVDAGARGSAAAQPLLRCQAAEACWYDELTMRGHA